MMMLVAKEAVSRKSGISKESDSNTHMSPMPNQLRCDKHKGLA